MAACPKLRAMPRMQRRHPTGRKAGIWGPLITLLGRLPHHMRQILVSRQPQLRKAPSLAQRRQATPIGLAPRSRATKRLPANYRHKSSVKRTLSNSVNNSSGNNNMNTTPETRGPKCDRTHQRNRDVPSADQSTTSSRRTEVYFYQTKSVEERKKAQTCQLI